ncbi:hypothetical protein Kpol_2000p112 [Vanderwaltozyma polyspora DSM 70294]|uniref:ATP-dependent RNA helicase n=1 Tax=Vanderwaltozyma polyspora (strain ATCC 22028 / DSM 70294 / BCRC 21397 / CBS 2163 / NBRC 10782 / NRRL Y-8283 / UCD 57-17) TaxID=436907 RepID=A7TFB9_VANPO|nr:uncharacterized protein Kpol_2000p112 [Vanderwaltozyma polyspora DSM 70294]EDO19144.1 hypothetical protein Kpol_2000p112 [Vanderwaltozyma polyspora DSM 70294]
MNYVMNRDLLNEISSESNLNQRVIDLTPQQDLSDNEFTSQVLESYLFVDPIRGTLIDYNKFSFLSKHYPSCELEDLRFNFRALRHVIIGIKRYELSVDDTGMRIDPAVARQAGHSLSTDIQRYGVNSTGMTGYQNTTTTIYGYFISKPWIKLLGLGYEVSNLVPKDVKLNKEKPNFLVSGNMKCIIAKCDEIYGDSFKIKPEQMNVCIDVCFGSSDIIPVQALPGFGKTAIFEIPLNIISTSKRNKHFVSFVFVPYSCLLYDIMDRFKLSGTLKIGDVKDILRNRGFCSEAELTGDVYFRIFHDFGKEQFLNLINNWYDIFQNTILGMVIVDEAHNLVCEQGYRMDSFFNISNICFDKAWKVLLLSGTVGKSMMGEVTKFLGYSQDLTYDATDNKNILWYNFVKNVPLSRIDKEFILTKDRSESITLTLQLVEGIIKSIDNPKIILVRKEREMVEIINQNLVNNNISSCYVHGKLTSEEKTISFNRFKKNKEKKILVGTKLVSEGINIPELKYVILVNYLPQIHEYIQTAGRIRGESACITLWNEACRDEFSINSKCIVSQMSSFYGLANISEHESCCGSYKFLNNNNNDRLLEVLGKKKGKKINGLIEERNEIIKSSVEEVIRKRKFCTSGTNEMIPSNKKFHNEMVKNNIKVTLKEDLHAKFKNARNIFEFLGITGNSKSALIADGVEQSYFDFLLYDSDLCSDCTGTDGICYCWDKKFTLKQCGISCFAFMKMAMTDEMFSAEINKLTNSSLLERTLSFVERKSSMKELFKTNLSGYCKFVTNGNILEVNKSLDFRLIVSTYNWQWKKLKDEKLDVFWYFYDGSCRDATTIWDEPYEVYYRKLVQSNFSDYASVSFKSTEDTSFKFFKSLFNFKKVSECSNYNEIEDMKQRSKFGNIDLDLFVIDNKKFLLMILGLYYNVTSRNILNNFYTQLPNVKMFHQWMKLQRTWINIKTLNLRNFNICQPLYYYYPKFVLELKHPRKNTN